MICAGEGDTGRVACYIRADGWKDLNIDKCIDDRYLGPQKESEGKWQASNTTNVFYPMTLEEVVLNRGLSGEFVKNYHYTSADDYWNDLAMIYKLELDSSLTKGTIEIAKSFAAENKKSLLRRVQLLLGDNTVKESDVAFVVEDPQGKIEVPLPITSLGKVW